MTNRGTTFVYGRGQALFIDTVYAGRPVVYVNIEKVWAFVEELVTNLRERHRVGGVSLVTDLTPADAYSMRFITVLGSPSG